MKTIVKLFENFIKRFNSPAVQNKMPILLYSVLKTQGDILVEIRQFDLAIKAYKTLKDYCDAWGNMTSLKMKIYEQISVCYQMCDKYSVSMTYMKKAL